MDQSNNVSRAYRSNDLPLSFPETLRRIGAAERRTITDQILANAVQDGVVTPERLARLQQLTTGAEFDPLRCLDRSCLRELRRLVRPEGHSRNALSAEHIDTVGDLNILSLHLLHHLIINDARQVRQFLQERPLWSAAVINASILAPARESDLLTSTSAMKLRHTELLKLIVQRAHAEGFTEIDDLARSVIAARLGDRVLLRASPPLNYTEWSERCAAHYRSRATDDRNDQWWKGMLLRLTGMANATLNRNDVETVIETASAIRVSDTSLRQLAESADLRRLRMAFAVVGEQIRPTEAPLQELCGAITRCGLQAPRLVARHEQFRYANRFEVHYVPFSLEAIMEHGPRILELPPPLEQPRMQQMRASPQLQNSAEVTAPQSD